VGGAKEGERGKKDGIWVEKFLRGGTMQNEELDHAQSQNLAREGRGVYLTPATN